MSMKFNSLMRTLIAVALLGGSLQAQQDATKSSDKLPSGKEVIAKHIQAIGGKESLEKVKTLATKAKMSIPEVGIEGDITMFQTSSGKARMAAEIPQVGSQEAGTDGETLWESSSVTGAEILSGARADQAKMQFEINGHLNYDKWYQGIKCTGIEKFEGEDCYVVELTRPENKPTIEFYSVKTGLQRGNRQNSVTQMGEMEIETVYDDYKEVDGVKFAFSAVAKLPNGMSQQIKIDSVEINGKIDDSKFELPEDVKALKK